VGSLVAVAAIAAAGCDQEKEVILDDDDIVVAETAPPAISGGTLIVSADQKRAIAADPDRDVVWIVNLDDRKLERTIQLQPGDEPGRLVEDAAGLVHVALRRSGALVTLSPVTGEILRREPICAGPRGFATDAAKGQLHVACADGKLVTLDAATFAEVRRLTLDADLRDVLVQGDGLIVTRFRSAEVLHLDAQGAVVSRVLPPTAALPPAFSDGFESAETHFSPTVAWRTVAMPTGGVLMVHQRAQLEEIDTEIPGGYGGHDNCGSIVHSALTTFGVSDDGALSAPSDAMTRFGSVLPTDVAVSADGSRIAVAAAGSERIVTLHDGDLMLPAIDSCGFGESWVNGSPVAVAFRGDKLIAQIREPAALQLLDDDVRILLPGASVRDTGHDLFHLPPSKFQNGGDFDHSFEEPGFAGGGAGQLACASCHPEGGDDSHVWNFLGVGPLRTQAMRGGVLETAPLHWAGDMSGLDEIMTEVFQHRMGGPEAGPVRQRAMEQWVGRVPAPPRMRSPEDPAALRGKALFESEAVGCADCHNGAHYTNNKNADVGRGEALQVPTLVGVAWRAPFMHDGCAPTLMDRFDPACGGDKHGDLSGLEEADLQDIVAYLESI
jgi:hypothetical protein